MKMIYLIINNLELLGKIISIKITNLGKAGILLKNCFLKTSPVKIDLRQFFRNLYFIGFLSLGLIILSGFFIGIVVSIQGYYILTKFGADEILGQMTALIIIRELGPVLTALLFAGRTGASLTAEICLMKSTEQLISMDMMGIDPIKKIITPRFVAGIISMIFLSIIFIVMAIIGSYLSTVYWFNIDSDVFWISIKDNIDFKLDLISSLIKSTIFGFIITWVAVFQGINSNPTTEGIVISTTNTVVYSSFFILGLNFFLTTVMFHWK